MSLPDNNTQGMKLVDLGNYGLSVIHLIRKRNYLKSVVGVKVCVMQEYGLDNSWTELFDIAFPSPMQALQQSALSAIKILVADNY